MQGKPQELQPLPQTQQPELQPESDQPQRRKPALLLVVATAVMVILACAAFILYVYVALLK